MILGSSAYKHSCDSMTMDKDIVSIQEAENIASEQLFPELKDHLKYVNDAYNLAFKAQTAIEGKRLFDIADVTRAQLNYTSTTAYNLSSCNSP